MSEVLLRRSGNLIEASPQAGITGASLYELFRSTFKYSRRVRNDWRTARASGNKFRSEHRLLCHFSEGPQGAITYFAAGLLYRARILLERYQIGCTYQDLRKLVIPPPRIDLLEMDKMQSRDDQLKALAHIFGHDMGVIEAPTAYGKTFLICQICRAYPTIPLIICTYRKDVVDSIVDRLRSEAHVAPNELGVVRGGMKSPARVTVATIDSLEHAHPEKCRLFLYDEVHEAAADKRAKKIARIRDSRLFGFSASPKGRSDGADLAIEALFGPVIYRLPYQDAEAAGNVATITVDVMRVPGSEIPYDDDTAQFRYGIWRNPIRNRIIASIAAEHAANNRQVLIMVDKVEHGLFIRNAWLPEWPIVHGPVQHEQISAFQNLGILPNKSWLCTPDKRERYRQEFEAGKMRFAIATGVWSQGVDFRHLDVLVRCDARSSSIPNTQIPGRLSRGKTGLLVDFQDSFDDRFKRRSSSRIRDYRAKGWSILNKEFESTEV